MTSAEALSKLASRLGGHGVTLAVARLHKPAEEMAAKSGPLGAIGARPQAAMNGPGQVAHCYGSHDVRRMQAALEHR